MTLKLNTIHRMDAIEGLRRIKDNTVDLIITDPPYNIASTSRRTMSRGKIVRTSNLFGHWDSHHPFDYELLTMQVLTHGYRILKPGGSLYVFAANQQQGMVLRRAMQRGFTYRNHLAIIKKNPAPQFNHNNWRHAIELCLYLTKGKVATFNFLSQHECVNAYHHPARHSQTSHPTEKPLGLVSRLVEISSNPRELVVDPFMGSGTTAVASITRGRNFIGFEREVEYVTLARKRLREVA